MDRSIKPLQVSPLIKAVRWTLLLCGFIYGSRRLKKLEAFEMTDYIKRQRQIKEKYERLAAEDKNKTIGELRGLALEFEVTEMPPGWEKDI